MRNSIFNLVSKTTANILMLLVIGAVTVNAQSANYRCFCDASYPDGILGFEINVFNADPNDVWSIDDVINLYSSINPDVLLQNGTEMTVNPNDDTNFQLTGFAIDGQLPFVTILNDNGTSLPIDMTSCRVPTGEIEGEADLCVGGEATFDFNVTASNILNNSITWTANGATTTNAYGVDDLRFDVTYDTPGNYIIRVEGMSSTMCPISDNILVRVTDVSEDLVISGPDYLCSGAASNIMYQVTNPDQYQLSWTSNLATTITPMTGSGTMVDVSFPSAGEYVLEVTNADDNACSITGVDYAVSVVDVIDTIPVLGDAYVCQGGIENYTINNPGDYTNLQWSITPMTGVTMFPADGQADQISITYSEDNNYTINVTGDTADGCTLDANLDVVVPGDDVGTLACNNSVNVSLNNNCTLELLPEMILEGEEENNDAYTLVIVNADTGEELTDPMLSQEQLGQVYTITVIEECGGNSCWGLLTVEDKSIPSIVPFCEDLPIVTTCFDFDSLPSFPTGYPNFGPDSLSEYNPMEDSWLVSGFDACNDVLLTYEDESLTSDICADPQEIIRTWTAVDVLNGAETSCAVTINVTLLDASMIQWPNNYDSGLDADAFGDPDTDGIYPSLDPCNLNNETVLLTGDTWIEDDQGNPSPLSTGSPASDAFACPNLQVIGYKDQVLPVCGNSRKILRQWTVWDACNLTDLTHTQIITLMDVTAPVCSAPTETEINTDIHECGADVIVTPPTVTGECDSYTYQIRYSVNIGSGFIDDNVTYIDSIDRYVIEDVDFEADYIWVQYIVRDACGNETDDCYTEFTLIDNEQPIPACDLNNVVTLNSNGWAFAGPSTFDDHSWDNCGIYQSVVQKMDNRCECHEAEFDFLHKLGTYDGHTYFLSKEKMDGLKAERLAEALDGYVANVNDAEENMWIREKVDGYTNDEYFIGLSGSSTSTLAWSNADTTSYRNWSGVEPALSAVDDAKGDVYVVVDEEGEWNAERRNQLEGYYIVELENTCAWSQKVNFCCADVGQETMVMLRVIDFHGNHNFCMVNVNVMEFEKPFITCPADTIIPCDEAFDTSDLSQFGEATATDNCGIKEITDTNTGFANESCGRGVVVRTLTAVDYANNTRACTQRIFLQGENVFSYDDIVWPVTDTLVNEVCSLVDISPEITGVPTWNESDFACSNITYTHTDLMFYIVDGACQKLLRTWTVVDWCQNNMLWEEVQVIKLVNTVSPQISAETCAPMTYTSGASISQCEVLLDSIVAENEFLVGACNDSPNWSYTIDYNDDGTIDRTGNGNDASGVFGYGVNRLTWTIFDDCGNESSCDKLVTVLDNLPPTPYCHGTIVLPISDTINGVEIWASDLNLGSFDNCPTNQVYFSFSADAYITNTVLTCDDLAPGSNFGEVLLDLWIWDNLSPSLANKSSCQVTINLQDNQNFCDNIGTGNRVSTISGNVRTETLEMVGDVEMSISSNTMADDMMSTEGEFAFNNLEMYNDYHVDAFKDDNYLNGISTLDLVLIQRHILGLQSLDSPYKIIAADINNSESVTAIDLIELRKLILGIYDELPNNDSWRFVESAYTFVDEKHPFPYNENVEVYNLEKAVENADFIGVKIGDVNTSAVANAQSENISSRNAVNIFNVIVDSEITSKGNQHIKFVANEDVQLLGSQMSFRFDANQTELMAMIPMAIDLSNEHISWDRVGDGEFVLSWNALDQLDIVKGDVLFELLFKGDNANVQLSGRKGNLSSEMYTLDDNSVKTSTIIFEGKSKTAFEFSVEQNIPNPFKDETEIGFTLDKSGPVMLTITDQTGRLIYQEQNEYKAGQNAILISSEAIGASGLLYYQLATESQTVTKKMIVLQ